MKRRTGTTLLELMAVIAVIGILAVIAVPTASSVHRQRAGGNGARELALVLREAQARAQAHDTVVAVRVADDGGYVVRESRSGFGAGETASLGAGELGSRVSGTYPEGEVSFGVRGWPTLPGSSIPRAGSYTLSGGRRVVVQLGGCIRCL